MVRFSLLLSAVMLSILNSRVHVSGDDWPCWRGIHQDGIARESNLLKTWPDSGPQELWRVPLGEGFSGISVVNGKAYTMYAEGKDEFVVCLDTQDGSTVWKTPSGESVENQYGNGPRSTPTIDAGHVYTHGSTGSLLCLDAETGDKVWGFNTLERFNGKNLDYGLSASPVVVDDMLIVVVGAPDGKSLVALNKTTGDLLWGSLNDQGGYATPLLLEVDGLRQLAVLTGEAIVGVAFKDGQELWRHPWKTSEDANVATPIFHDGKLFVSSGYGTGCALFELSAENGKASANQLWASKRMKNYFSSSVLYEGHLYGFNNNRLACMEFETGDALWQERGFNRGSLLIADDLMFILGERGTLALAQPSADDYQELASVKGIIEPKTWTIPTIANGKIYLRNEQEMVCLQVAAE